MSYERLLKGFRWPVILVLASSLLSLWGCGTKPVLPSLNVPQPTPIELPPEVMSRDKPRSSMALSGGEPGALPESITTLPPENQLKILSNESLKLFSVYSDCKIKHTSLVEWIDREP